MFSSYLFAHLQRPCGKSGSRAAALVLTLSLLLLVTFGVIAFFSRTLLDRQAESATTCQQRTEILAQGAIQAVIGDLQQEMVSSSTSNTNNGIVTLLPNSDQDYLPKRAVKPKILMDNSAKFANLVKQSALGVDMTGGSKSAVAACNANSSTASRDGRFISSSRWSAPYLLLTDTNGFPNDSTYLPDWILLARKGIVSGGVTGYKSEYGDAKQGNPELVIGRFAINIYDESGLLDVNAAGYPSSEESSLAKIKGTVAGADLSQIPGLSGQSVGIDNFVAWRNGKGTAAFGSYDQLVTRFGQPSQFLLPWLSGSAPQPQSDNCFVQRQDLIRAVLYKRILGPSGALALPYLTTFSRELNAPSWRPLQNAADMSGSNGITNSFAYKDRADDASAPNRALMNVRIKSTFRRADGTTAAIGEPLIKCRFPLSRIAGLCQINGLTGLNGITTETNSTIKDGNLCPATEDTIKRDFGLVWNPGSGNPGAGYIPPHWDYYGDGTAPTWTIKTLEQVANAQREPNFFELLQAGILAGSLGNSAGRLAGSTYGDTEINTGDLDTFSGATGFNPRQILQIGANIIDQYDVDDIPTVISGEAPSSPKYGYVFGVENQPFISARFQTIFRNRAVVNQHDTTGFDPNPEVCAYEQFQVWNPHQNANTAPRRNYQIIASSGLPYIEFRNGRSNPIGTPTNIAGRYLKFSASGSDVANPLFLTTDNVTETSGVAGASDCGVYTANGAKLAGIRLGNVDAHNNYDNDQDNSNDYENARVSYNQKLAFWLLEDVPGLGWRPIHEIPMAASNLGVNKLSPAAQQSVGLKYDMLSYQTIRLEASSHHFTLADVRSDPRTLRCGEAGTPYLRDMYFENGGYALRPNSGNYAYPGYGCPAVTGFSIDGAYWKYSPNSPLNQVTVAFAELAENNTSSAVYLVDRDQVLRRGDAPSKNQNENIFSATSRARPVMLQASTTCSGRPFQSVAEMGYAFRDDPWKTLNFWTANSADAALLDFFTLVETADSSNPIRAGVINLNRAQPETIQALLSKAEISMVDRTSLTSGSSGQAGDIARALRKYLGGVNSPEKVIHTPSDLSMLTEQMGLPATFPIKAQSEVFCRTMAGITNARTWNLLIDIIVQSGRYSNARSLDDFTVQAERRYWVHVAIDRLTGRVVSQQVEPVHE